MTLPASFPISMSQIANELGLSLPMSINHPWALSLIGKSGFPISLSDFFGRTARFDGSIAATGSSPYGTITFSGSPFFNTTLEYALTASNSGNIIFNSAPSWQGNLRLRNNTTGVSAVFAPLGGSFPNQWGLNSPPANLIRGGFTDNFSLTLSS